MRAGQVVAGQEACLKAIRRETAAVVLIDQTVAENSFEKISAGCEHHQIPFFPLPAGRIGKAIGKENRTVVAVTAGPLSKKILAKILNMDKKLSWQQKSEQPLNGRAKIDE